MFPNWSPRFAVYGDLGNDNGQSFAFLEEQIQMDDYDIVAHIGDLAYDLHTDNARVGDEFMRQIQPIAGYVPYQTVPGNHERAYNYSNYNNRFTMHSQNDPYINNYFWSYNIGPVHVIGINTDFYQTQEFGDHQLHAQYRWLKNDLMKANLPANRAQHPWIMTFGHHPFYYQNRVDEKYRKGWPGVPSLEKLLYKYGVDLAIWGHDHIYTRFWPTFDEEIYKGSEKEPYRNPKAPVHIISGSAGCREFVTPVCPKPNKFTAYASSDYGFMGIHFINHTHIHLEQFSINRKGQVIDEFYLIKDEQRTYFSY
ncbi:purple acid phosphatase-like protein [Sarcoptes scabiei]|uniref:Purple acid phosphatase-like protein n=1 Tax=Sarcoptes scabiei TaxID=52283 RepID=A0A132AM37_SARSC|nr:purple acid phosphatase-like protein [Sarcoptes scabiei]